MAAPLTGRTDAWHTRPTMRTAPRRDVAEALGTVLGVCAWLIALGVGVWVWTLW